MRTASPTAAQRQHLTLRPLNWWRLTIRFARVRPLSALGGIVILVLLVVAAGAPVLAPYDPVTINLAVRLQPPSDGYPLGTDQLGRDILSRILFGSQVSLYVGVFATLFGVGIGTMTGIVSGYFGGAFDTAVQRVMDVLQAFPLIILAVALVVALGSSVNNVVIALAVALIPTTNRVIRSAVLGLRERAFVEAARAMGADNLRIMVRHILPNVLAPAIILVSIDLGLAILVESSLSFLGLGPPPPTATWGSMLGQDARANFARQPWLAIAPGVAITLTVLGFNLLGDGLRDELDPSLRGQGH